MKMSYQIIYVYMFVFSFVANAKEINVKIPIEDKSNIELVAKQGDFTISGWDENFVNLYGETYRDAEVETGNSILRLILNSTDVDTENDKLEIKIPRNRDVKIVANDANFSINNLEARFDGITESGDMDVNNFNSELLITSVDGDVNVKESSGDFTIETINGDITILNSRGVADIKSISGNQTVEADLRTISSSNVSGESIFKLNTLEKFNLNNVNGNSSVISAISSGANVKMQSVTGDLRLSVPELTSAKFSLQSFQNGSIHNTLKDKVTTFESNDSAEIFSLSDASGNVELGTMDGRIEVGSSELTYSQPEDDSYDWSSVDSSILDFAYVNPNINFMDYQEVFIKQPEIHFDESWVKEYGENKTKTYRERIAIDYAESFKKAIVDKFSNDLNLKISNERGEGVLVIIPKVIELYIDKPETVDTRNVFSVTSAGKAKIDFVIYSSKDEAILSLITDKRSTSKPSGIPDTNLRTMNYRAFNTLFNSWAEDIVKVLGK